MESSRLSTEVTSKKSKPSRLISIFSLLLIIALFIIIVLITYIIQDKHRQQAGVCMTGHCVSIAAKIINSMNASVNPCEDFYEFACGSWIKSNPIPEDENGITTFKKNNDVMLLNLKDILEAPDTNETSKEEITMKTLYNSCQNIDKINELDKKPLEDLLKRFGGGSMFNSNWKEKDFNITNSLIQTKFLDSSLFFLTVVPDDENSNKQIIRIEQGKISSLKSHYTDPRFEKTKKAYDKLILTLARFLNPTATNETLKKDLEEFLMLEEKLINITLKEEVKRQVKDNKIKTLVEMNGLFSSAFDFKLYIRSIFHPLFLPDEEPISVITWDYISKLPPILKATSPRVMANFLSIKVAMKNADNLAQRFIDAKFSYNKVLAGTQSDRPRWVGCVSLTNDFMGQILGKMYVKKHFDSKAKDKAVEMIREIKNSFLSGIDDIQWMEESTKKVAKEKVKSMKEHIGYPEYIFNQSYIAEEFKDLKFQKDAFFSNVIHFEETTEKQKMLLLRAPVDREKWLTFPTQINAYYSPKSNQITFPAAILQFPFYHEENLKSLNFGGIGMVIGHEILHGFDDKGSLYDKNGNLKDWWPLKDREKFLNLTSCIVNQYNKYSISGIDVMLNGNLTQGENIADNGGLKQSFRAYQKWIDKNGPEPTLPGLPYNNQQLFYITFGQIWCNSYRPEYSLQNAKTSKHPPGKYRVLGSLVNSKSFSESFNCPVGSPMNPEKKCNVW